MMKPEPSHGTSLEIKMTPMIDVVFLLLIFFVWTSTFEVPEYDLPGSIAEPPLGGSIENVTSEETPEVFDEIVVRMLLQDAATIIQLNGQQVSSIQELKSKVSQIVSLGVQPPVIVDPDGRVTMDRAIEVYDAVRTAGADRVLFAASP